MKNIEKQEVSEKNWINLIPKNLRDKFNRVKKNYLKSLEYFFSNKEKYGLKQEYLEELRIFVYLKSIYETVVLSAITFEKVASSSEIGLESNSVRGRARTLAG